MRNNERIEDQETFERFALSQLDSWSCWWVSLWTMQGYMRVQWSWGMSIRVASSKAHRPYTWHKSLSRMCLSCHTLLAIAILVKQISEAWSRENWAGHLHRDIGCWNMPKEAWMGLISLTAWSLSGFSRSSEQRWPVMPKRWKAGHETAPIVLRDVQQQCYNGTSPWHHIWISMYSCV